MPAANTEDEHFFLGIGEKLQALIFDACSRL